MSVDMTSSGKNGLNIRTNASCKWDRTTKINLFIVLTLKKIKNHDSIVIYHNRGVCLSVRRPCGYTLRWCGNKIEVEKREWWRGIVGELLLSCPVCSLEKILHFVITNRFIRSIIDDKIELNRYDKIENCLNVSLSANFLMLARALKNDCRLAGLYRRYALDISIVLSCRMSFLPLGLNCKEAHVSVFVFFVIIYTRPANMTKTPALRTLKLDVEVLFHNPLSSVS